MENERVKPQLKDLEIKVDTLDNYNNVSHDRNMSGSIDGLAASLCKAQAEYPVIGKNRSGRFSFVDKDYVKKSIDPVLLKYGLSVTSGLRVQDGQEIFFVKLMHSSGQFQVSECMFDLDGPKNGSKCQAKGSTITYMSRYMYIEILGITINESPDDNNGEVNSNVSYDVNTQGVNTQGVKPWQNNKELIGVEGVNKLKELSLSTQKSILQYNKVTKLEDLTQSQYSAFKEKFYIKNDNAHSV